MYVKGRKPLFSVLVFFEGEQMFDNHLGRVPAHPSNKKTAQRGRRKEDGRGADAAEAGHAKEEGTKEEEGGI